MNSAINIYIHHDSNINVKSVYKSDINEIKNVATLYVMIIIQT